MALLRTASTLAMAVATVLLVRESASVAQNKEKSNADFGLGVSARQIQLTRGVAELFYESAPPGTRTEGYSVEFARRGKQLEFVLGFGYDNLEAINGHYLETAGDPLVPGQVDYTDFSGFHWYTMDATLVGYLKVHKILSVRYGAGLGVGLVRGKITRTDSICTSDNLRSDCVPDPNGIQREEPVDIPKALPILNGFVGLQFRPVRGLAINLDAGLRNVPYLGVSAMFYLW